MKHYFITNREIEKRGSKETVRRDGREEATDELRFGTYDTATQDLVLFPDMGLIRGIAGNAAKENEVLNTTSAPEFYAKATQESKPSGLTGSGKVFRELYDSMLKEDGGDVLVYVHGYNNDLDSALEELVSLEKELVLQPGSPVKTIVLFTWPAMRKLLRYRNDHRDAELSGYALGRSFLMLRDFFISLFGKNEDATRNQPCGRKIHLMCHSKGNYVVESMMKMLLTRMNTVSALFEEVILVASDISWDCLEDPNPMYRITEICSRVHIYFHKNDQALFISETTKNPSNRLGRYGPRDMRRIPSNVFVVNCSEVTDQSGLKDRTVNHWYHHDSATVQRDMLKVLAGFEIDSHEYSRFRLSDGKYLLKY